MPWTLSWRHLITRVLFSINAVNCCSFFCQQGLVKLLKGLSTTWNTSQPKASKLLYSQRQSYLSLPNFCVLPHRLILLVHNFRSGLHMHGLRTLATTIKLLYRLLKHHLLTRAPSGINAVNCRPFFSQQRLIKLLTTG